MPTDQNKVVIPQKFHHGDHVRLVDPARPFMPHFHSGDEAIIDYSYQDKYGGDGRWPHYAIFVKGQGWQAWTYEKDLELIEKDRPDLLAEWEAEREKYAAERSDLDWIFSHGREVIESGCGPSVVGLAKCLDISVNDLWGAAGEGITYFERSMMVLSAAAPFLEAGDRDGWLSFAAARKAEAAKP